MHSGPQEAYELERSDVGVTELLAQRGQMVPDGIPD
jgi:hypothetical protein